MLAQREARLGIAELLRDRGLPPMETLLADDMQRCKVRLRLLST